MPSPYFVNIFASVSVSHNCTFFAILMVSLTDSMLPYSMKSTGRSDPLQRSAAFWGEESDMEESEMSVPMGTLKSDDLKDDFDFYD